MSSMMIAISTKTLKMKNPMFLAFAILFISILSANMTYKTSSNSWLSFILILTFSSGMMTLFIYTTSMAPNEKTKNKKTFFIIMISFLVLKNPMNSTKEIKNTMKTFSSKLMIMIMTTILILTMLSISIYGHHPNQTISSSF